LDYVAVADAIGLLKNKFSACIDSSTSTHYCLDCTKFQNYQSLEDHDITTEDGQTLKAVGISDVQFELKNGSKYIPVLLNTIYTPDMAFTLILISQLDEADCLVNF
jgi:hypothetical protein